MTSETEKKITSEREKKRKETSTSKYLCDRTTWWMIYGGNKPTAARMENVMRQLQWSGRCNIERLGDSWLENQRKVTFKHSTSGSTALKSMRNLLKHACVGSYEWESVDFDFLEEERPAKIYKSQRGSDAGPAAGPEAAEAPEPLDPNKDCGSASVAEAESGESRHRAKRMEELRFKAMALLAHPCVEAWLPTPNLVHGQGGFGKVVFGRQPGRALDVAIKTTGARLTAEAKHTLRFMMEMEGLMAAQGHPCIIELLDVVSGPSGDLGLVSPRYGQPLELSMRRAAGDRKQRVSGKVGIIELLLPFREYYSLFAGLISALAFLAQKRLAHSDIKPDNICFDSDRTREKLVLCDFGASSFLKEGCFYAWQRERIIAEGGVEVASLPYRPPELLFGKGIYDVAIDVWSLGVVMAEVAETAFLFRWVDDAKQLRKVLREKGGARGDLITLKQLPFGTETDWVAHPETLITPRMKQYLGDAGAALLRGMLRLDPLERLTADAALAEPFFSCQMHLLRWKKPGEVGEDPRDMCFFEGGRGRCHVTVASLRPDVLDALRKDEYWGGDEERDWEAPCGSRRKKDQKRMRIEMAEEGSCDPALAEANVKIQITGRTGEKFRGSVNNMNCAAPCPARSLAAFIEAFKACNEPAWTMLDDMLLRGPMSRFSEDELGENGRDILKQTSRNWFGNICAIQLTRLRTHKENIHYDGGAAIMLLVLTLNAERRVDLFG